VEAKVGEAKEEVMGWGLAVAMAARPTAFREKMISVVKARCPYA
jgi:hypothetical protein